MKRAAWASSRSTFIILLLLCFLHNKAVGVEAVIDTVPARSHERTHHVHDDTATKRVKVTRENGNQWAKSAIGDSSSNWEHARTHSEEKRAAPKIQVNTHTITTTTAARTEERSEGNIYYGRSSGNGVSMDNKNERTRTRHHDYYGGGTVAERTDSSTARTEERSYGNKGKSERTRTRHHHYYGEETTERTNSGPSPTRSSHHVDESTRGGTTTTECRHGATKCNRNGRHDENNDTKSDDSSTQSKVERLDRHSSTERSPLTTASSRPSSKERKGGEEEERPAVQAKTEAHPIGLISALDKRKGTKSRSMDLNPRELDATSTIIAAALIGFAVVVFMLFCVAEVCGKRREKKADSIRLIRVFQYLHHFDSDDIDIQLSAAGGFHVGYLNELANGINKKQPPNKKIDTAYSFRAKKEGDQQSDTSISDNSENSTGLSDKV